ncbi:MAG: DUF4037 domain-containing protein [Patescibacteria group bacterium]
MEIEELAMRAYVENKLYKTKELVEFVEKASILQTENEPGLVWDVMILLPDDSFQEFSGQYGECFVVDDHDHHPNVFTRVKSFEWLRKDFTRRLPIALWIYQHSLVLADKGGGFDKIIQEQMKVFDEAVPETLRKKYLEFRTERHNLRHALKRKETVSELLIKATVVKLGLEMIFLAQRKPYPYKKWLPSIAGQETRCGKIVLQISNEFLSSGTAETTLELSNRLVEKIVELLDETRMFSKDFLERWWLYLV